jgi:hypothetical protein
LSQKLKNDFDLTSRTAAISPIFSWFKKDFGGRPQAVLKFLAPFLPTEIRADIETNAAAWRVRYSPYDWDLNE